MSRHAGNRACSAGLPRFGLAETAACSSPRFDVAPVPDERSLECCDGFWEVRVPLAPDVNDLGAAHAKSFCDLVCSDDVVGVNRLGHEGDRNDLFA